MFSCINVFSKFWIFKWVKFWASVLFSVHSYCSLNPSSLSSPSISESPVDCILTSLFYCTWGSNYSTYFNRSLGCLQPLILTYSRQIPLNEFHPVSAGWDLAITGFTQSETVWSKKKLSLIKSSKFILQFQKYLNRRKLYIAYLFQVILTNLNSYG